MADYAVFQNQWLFATLLGGGMLLLAFVLCYWAMWRPRSTEREADRQNMEEPRSFLTWLFGVFPWAIILAIIGIAVYTLVHTGIAALKPPNW